MNQCILFALARESWPFLRRFPSRQRLAISSFPVWVCDPPDGCLHVVETGIGRQRCLKALAELWVSGLLNGKRIIGAGFAGALAEGWHVGDVLLPREVIDEQGHCWPTSQE